MRLTKNLIFLVFLIIYTPLKVFCYEKTLRKIIRSTDRGGSKMVQRPFSDMIQERGINIRSNLSHKSDFLLFSGRAKTSKIMHRVEIPLTSHPSHQDMNLRKGVPIYNKISKNTAEPMKTLNNITPAPSNYYRHSELSTLKKFLNNTFATINFNKNHNDLSRQKQSILSKPKINKVMPQNEEVIIIPFQNISVDSSSSLKEDNFLQNPDYKAPHEPNAGLVIPNLDYDKADYSLPSENAASNNNTRVFFSCLPLHKTESNIDTEAQFANFDIEPTWASKKHYWSNIYDARYESLLRNPKWPSLKVILIPRTHVDSIWKRTFERGHNESVNKIITNIVKKMQFYKNLTFTWNEVSHLSQWWDTATIKSRMAFRRLLRQGRLEIAAAGWVESDEATSNIFGLVHQLIEGQQWLKMFLNYEPEVAWLTNSVTHSPTMAYLLSASEINNLVLTNVHFSWEEYFAEYRISDFVWIQNWNSDYSTQTTTLSNAFAKMGKDRLPKHSVLTHYLQFNSADFNACGPNRTVCTQISNTIKAKSSLNALSNNITQTAEMLLEQYSKTGTVTPHNTIIAPLGNAYYYEKQVEFDYQYINYQKIAEYINLHREVYNATIEFGTAKDYFRHIYAKHSKLYPTLSGDFSIFADLNDGKPAYWTGYFTSRPWLKILIRRMQSDLRSAEILFSFAINSNVFKRFDVLDLFNLLINVRAFVARLQDRHVVSGTLTENTMKYLYKQMLSAIKNIWYIQEAAVSLLSIKPNKPIQTPYLVKYIYRNGELLSIMKTVGPGDQIYAFNSLANERTEVIELTVRNPNIRVLDHSKKDVTIQINPVWKYSSDNIISISRQFFKVLFSVSVPPLSLELYLIKETFNGSLNVAALYCSACMMEELASETTAPFPFTIKPVESGDIQLESYKHKLVFDEKTGFLKEVTEKSTGIERTVIVDYGAFRSSHFNSGTFLFKTNNSKPLRDIILPYRVGLKTSLILIISGHITTEITSICGRILQSSAKIFNLLNCPLSNAILIESKVDYEASPKNRELEMFVSIQTNIENGYPPNLFTDNNGFQYSAKLINVSRRIEANMYPMTTMAFIQDFKVRLSVITDHTQGITAVQEGQIIVMLDRRVLYNDDRGTNEGLTDSTATSHRHYLLLENFQDDADYLATTKYLQLPSLTAIRLANAADYPLDIFVIDKSKSDYCHYAFLPLLRHPFPCDIFIINFRVNIDGHIMANNSPRSALLVLHRQSASCGIIDESNLHCREETSFSLDKIFKYIEIIYKTNLSGTKKGFPIKILNRQNFAPMEIVSLRLFI